MSAADVASTPAGPAGAGQAHPDIAELAGEHEHVSGIAHVISVLTAQHRKPADGSDARAAATAEDLSAIYEPEPAPLNKLVADFHALAGVGPESADPFLVRAALLARKGDVARAVALFKNNREWRARIGIRDDAHFVLTPSMLEQLKTGLMVSPGTRDRNGRAAVFLRMRLAQPSKFSALDTVRLAAFVMEWTLRAYPHAITHGVSFFQDMRDMRFSNMDLRVPGELRNAFAQKLPVRVASIQVVNPPLFMRAVFAVIGPFMTEKLKARTRLIAKQEALAEIIEPSQMLEDCGLGGTFKWTDEVHESWCRKLEQDSKRWPTA